MTSIILAIGAHALTTSKYSDTQDHIVGILMWIAAFGLSFWSL